MIVAQLLPRDHRPNVFFCRKAGTAEAERQIAAAVGETIAQITQVPRHRSLEDRVTPNSWPSVSGEDARLVRSGARIAGEIADRCSPGSLKHATDASGFLALGDRADERRHDASTSRWLSTPEDPLERHAPMAGRRERRPSHASSIARVTLSVEFGVRHMLSLKLVLRCAGPL